MKSLYDILGVGKDATRETIKKAYRKLAMKTHPDRKGGNQEQFKQVTLAYNVLQDDESREYYDRTGSTETPKMNESESVLAQIFDTIIQNKQDGQVNFVHMAGNIIRTNIDDLEDKLEKMYSAQRRVSALSGRVQAKGDNIFQRVIDGRLEDIEKDITTSTRRIDVLKTAYDMVQQHTDDYCEPESPMRNFGNNGLRGFNEFQT